MVEGVFSGALWLKPAFWVALAFIIFVLVFGRRLWAALRGMLDNRTETIRRELEEASRLRREAEVMLHEAAERRATALAEAEAMLAQAREEASRLAESLGRDAAAGARRRERMAHERIAAAEKAALDEVRIAAADLAAAAAQRVIAETLAPESADRLIDHAIAGLPAALRAA